MSVYAASLEDMCFVLRHLVEIQELAELPGSEVLEDQELVHAILEQAGHFASEVLLPLDRVGELEGARWTDSGAVTTPGFKQAYKKLLRDGWNRVAMPAEYGGQDMPAVVCSAISEIFSAANKAFMMCPNVAPESARTLMSCGSDKVKSAFIPKLVSGE